MTTDLAILDQSVRNWLKSGKVNPARLWKEYFKGVGSEWWIALNHAYWIRREYRRLLAERDTRAEKRRRLNAHLAKVQT